MPRSAMPWPVVFHDAFPPEVNALPKEVQKSLAAHIRLLIEFGPGLGCPSVDTLKGKPGADQKTRHARAPEFLLL